MIGHLRRESVMGGYEAAAAAAEEVERTYSAIAELIGCHVREVAVVENATRAWDLAFYSLPFREGDRILTARSEYASNVIAFLQVARRTLGQLSLNVTEIGCDMLLVRASVHYYNTDATGPAARRLTVGS